VLHKIIPDNALPTALVYKDKEHLLFVHILNTQMGNEAEK
jgi:hypothetical protein